MAVLPPISLNSSLVTLTALRTAPVPKLRATNSHHQLALKHTVSGRFLCTVPVSVTPSLFLFDLVQLSCFLNPNLKPISFARPCHNKFEFCFIVFPFLWCIHPRLWSNCWKERVKSNTLLLLKLLMKLKKGNLKIGTIRESNPGPLLPLARFIWLNQSNFTVCTFEEHVDVFIAKTAHFLPCCDCSCPMQLSCLVV